MINGIQKLKKTAHEQHFLFYFYFYKHKKKTKNEEKEKYSSFILILFTDFFYALFYLSQFLFDLKLAILVFGDRALFFKREVIFHGDFVVSGRATLKNSQGFSNLYLRFAPLPE